MSRVALASSSSLSGAPRGWILTLTSLVFLLPSVWALVRAWSSEPYAGHGTFVPVLSALMLWSRRDRLRSDGGQFGGVLLVGGAIALAVLGHASQSLTAHTLAVVAAAAGVGLALRGPAWVRQAAFPLGFLLFMLPLPREFVAMVTLDLQQFVARFSAVVLELFHIPVYQEGLLLHLPDISLRVDQGCNGLRFLMVLLVLIIAFAQMSVPSSPRRLTVIAAAIPVAILANALRVAAIAAATQLVGPHAASGWIHDYIGRGVWAATIIVMVAFAVMVSRSERLSVRIV